MNKKALVGEETSLLNPLKELKKVSRQMAQKGKMLILEQQKLLKGLQDISSMFPLESIYEASAAFTTLAKIDFLEELINLQQKFLDSLGSCTEEVVYTFMERQKVNHSETSLRSLRDEVISETIRNFMIVSRDYFHSGSSLVEKNSHHYPVPKLRRQDTICKSLVNIYKAHKLENNCSGASEASVPIEGWLLKRDDSAFRSNWKRKFFLISDNRLCYYNSKGIVASVLEDDLKLCLVKPTVIADKKFCFEVISPSNSVVLQADSQEKYELWLVCIQNIISSSLQESSGTVVGGVGSGPSTSKIIKIPGNQICADCEAPNPEWSSINWGVVICIECSGIHRSLGVHISKVRALKLDVWEKEVIQVVKKLGNATVNSILEGNLLNKSKPGPKSEHHIKEKWIREKYVFKSFAKKEILTFARHAKLNDSWTVGKLDKKLRLQSANSISNDEDDDVFPDTYLGSVGKSLSLPGKESYKSEMLHSVMKVGVFGAFPSCFTEENSKSSSTPLISNTDQIIDISSVLFGKNQRQSWWAEKENESGSWSESSEDESDKEASSPIEKMESLNPNTLLYRASRVHNLPIMLYAIVLGADVDWQCNLETDVGRTAMHQSILSGSTMTTQFLMLHNANTVAADNDGNTVFDLAAKEGNRKQMALLLRHRNRREGK